MYGGLQLVPITGRQGVPNGRRNFRLQLDQIILIEREHPGRLRRRGGSIGRREIDVHHMRDGVCGECHCRSIPCL